MKARNVVEWAVVAASAIGILVLVGVLVLEGLRESRPADPQIELRTEEARQSSLGWLLPASVSNGGDEAAEDVVLEASAEVAGEPEISEIGISFLPAGSTVEIAFAFSGRPAGEVTVRLVGFLEP